MGAQVVWPPWAPKVRRTSLWRRVPPIPPPGPANQVQGMSKKKMTCHSQVGFSHDWLEQEY
jgi:hypothetical protein